MFVKELQGSLRLLDADEFLCTLARQTVSGGKAGLDREATYRVFSGLL